TSRQDPLQPLGDTLGCRPTLVWGTALGYWRSRASPPRAFAASQKSLSISTWPASLPATPPMLVPPTTPKTSASGRTSQSAAGSRVLTHGTCYGAHPRR